MPSFEFTSPEGKKYTVAGPDGATQEQAFQMLQSQLSGSDAPATPTVKTVAQLPQVADSGLLSNIGSKVGNFVSSGGLGQLPMLATQEGRQNLGNLYAGAVRGAGSIGSTLLAPIDYATDYIKGDRNQTLSGLVLGAPKPLSRNAERRQGIDAGLQDMGAQPDSPNYKVGKIGAEIAGTAGTGGVLAKGVSAIAPFLMRAGVSAPTLDAIGNGLATGGFKAGAVPGIANIATRIGTGAATGAGTAALVDPHDAGFGAMVGGALPPVLSGAGKVAAYAGRGIKSIVQPFTQSGQQDIAGNIIRKFADGGPTAIDASQLVPGSLPTLAEATGNPGIARLQSATSDLSPNAFSARQAANSDARTSAFDNIAQDPNAIAAAKTARDDAAGVLYGNAFNADAMRRDLAATQQAARAPFSGVGASTLPDDLATPGLRALTSRPDFRSAVEDAKKLAANNGTTLADPLQSLEGLHYVKLALDDMLNPTAKTAMGRNASGAIMDMRDKLASELSTISPLYGNARTTFAAMSQPVNQMQTLQGLNLTDATGNMTLSKAKNAISSLTDLRNAPGIDPAKSLTGDHMATLQAIHDDLLRKANLNAGKSAGSNTFQNIATNNILSTLLPGGLGALAQSKVGGLLGQVGKLAYSGSNDAIKGQLVDMMLNPALAKAALGPKAIAGPNAFERLLKNSKVQQPLYRVAPLLSFDQ